MAKIRFTSPYSRKTGTTKMQVNAPTLKDALRQVIDQYPDVFLGLLDEEEKLTDKSVVFIQGRNAKTLDGAESKLTEDTDVLIVPLLSSG